VASELAIAVLAAAIGHLGRPGIDLWPCTAIALLVFMNGAVRASSPWTCALQGLTFGIALMPIAGVGALGWGLAPVLALVVAGAVLYKLPLALLCYFGARLFRPRELVLAATSAWALWLWLWDFIGIPLKISLHGLIDHLPWLFWGARLVGANVVSGLLIAGCLGFTSAFVRLRGTDRWQALRPVYAVLGVLGVLALLARVSAAEASGTVRVGVPQLNVESSYYAHRYGLPEVTRALESRLAGQLAALSDVDVLAMTELFDGRYGLLFPAKLNAWRERARSLGQASLVTSYLVSQEGRRLNAVAGIAADGRLVGIHHKVNLAAFGEAQLSAGRGFSALPVRAGLRVGALICQEVVLAQGPLSLARQGSNLLVATTSDISFLSSVLVFEHFATAQSRAIETGRSIVWASNGGRSGLISRWGNAEGLSKFRSAEAVRLNAPLYDDVTPYVQTAWLWPILSGLALLGLAFRTRADALAMPAPLQVPLRRSLALLAAAIAGGGSTVFFSPALVELRHGDPRRAYAAVIELWWGPSNVYAREPPLARFAAEQPRSLDGALAYYLGLYEPQVESGTLPGQRGTQSLSGARDYLLREFGLETREVALELGSLPRVPTLVQLKTGTFGVFTYGGTGPVILFDPVSATRTHLPLNRLAELIEMRGVIPAASVPR
jgi:apolipoprotein N-acyltransferase